jgi:HrpA-like RNA helicase
MPLPTLLRKNSIIPNNRMPKSEKDAILNTRGIDYIINFISDRIRLSKGNNPKVVPITFGEKVIVLKSETGSGKSTVIPPFIYQMFKDRVGGNTIVTQPRILTAIDIPMSLPENYTFLELDINLGYMTGEFKRTISKKGIIYATIGVLLQQLKCINEEEFVKKYSFILIDEVHERSIDTDMTLFLLKKILVNNFKDPNCPLVILMSATFNPKIFIDYFECPEQNYIQAAGATYPIEKHFAKYDVSNYIEYATNLAKKLHVKYLDDLHADNKFRDILIFVQSSGVAKKIVNLLHAFNSQELSKDDMPNILKKLESEKNGGASVNDSYYIAPISLNKGNFELGGTEYQNLFSDINNIMVPIFKLDKGIITTDIQKWVKPTRRIIVSTNIAETGVTIDTLKYCIDTGWIMSSEFNPDFGVDVLMDKNITEGMAIQRRGRVGRKSPGVWYSCYTESVFNKLQSDQFAQILSDDITDILLGIIMKETESEIITDDRHNITEKMIIQDKLFQKHHVTDNKWYKFKPIKPLNISTVDFLETPSANSLNYSMEKLYGLGLINNSYEPTLTGYYCNLMRKIPTECKRMIMAGYSYGANILDLVTITAFIVAEPRYIYHPKYKSYNLLSPKVDDSDWDFYNKIILNCEFTEFLLVWYKYSAFLDKLINSSKNKFKDPSYVFSIKKIEKYCTDHKLIYSKLIELTAIRNEIIEGLINLGLNPYYNGMGLKKGVYNLLSIFNENLSDGLSEVKKIKKCILDGYRFNLVIWDNKIKQYILHHRNIPVQIIKNKLITRMGNDAEQTNANFIILSNIMVRTSQKNPDMYEFMSTGSISIMDQYLDIDLKFLLN